MHPFLRGKPYFYKGTESMMYRLTKQKNDTKITIGIPTYMNTNKSTVPPSLNLAVKQTKLRLLKETNA